MAGPFDLTKSQRFLVEWLSREDWSQVGECKGADLDHLISEGLAEYGPHSPRGDDYRVVRLTATGHEAARQTTDREDGK